VKSIRILSLTKLIIKRLIANYSFIWRSFKIYRGISLSLSLIKNWRILWSLIDFQFFLLKHEEKIISVIKFCDYLANKYQYRMYLEDLNNQALEGYLPGELSIYKYSPCHYLNEHWQNRSRDDKEGFVRENNISGSI